MERQATIKTGILLKRILKWTDFDEMLNRLEKVLNYTLLSIPKEEYAPTVEELSGEYLEKWGTE